MTATIATPRIGRLSAALPFWLSLLLIPIVWVSAIWGGWALLLVPVCTWYLFGIIDIFAGLNEANPDTATPDDQLWWYRIITIIWAPLQVGTVFGVLYYATQTNHLDGWELVALFFGVGIVTGTVGINYAHELMHQRPKVERWMADILLAMVLYSHFRSEHLLVHHRYVGTPRDPVTARYNEGFHRFFPRVLVGCYVSAFRVEKAKLARKDRPWHDSRNPFWRYWALQLAFLTLAAIIGGWLGVALFVWQAFIAAWHLELVNYIEHYGLTREHLGNGKYEHVKPHHSWNSAQKVSNWLLINLQRHSDHHYKPDRRFPLLPTYAADDAPQLPYGYSVMGIVAMMPPVWRRMMNPQVKKWRRQHHPHITDWSAYKAATHPWPR
ncbi:alkane 1-monooxygenase [Loktanella sp. DJP18]|uniref:alkane 1-monooxygenase n=1 Tax=Loktanella sp. DJP18 TaxID=3409788 RepID=UPI003BB792B5